MARKVLTNEEIDAHIAQGRALRMAIRSGDREEIRKAAANYKPDAETLMDMKLTMGADHIRSLGVNLIEAEREYGPDWLDR